MQKYVCNVCGYEYDPAAGDPDSGIAPGTAFEDLPEDWVCPVCGASLLDVSAASESGSSDRVDSRPCRGSSHPHVFVLTSNMPERILSL